MTKIGFFILLLGWLANAQSQDLSSALAIKAFEQIDQAALLITNKQGEPLYARAPQQPYVPASLVKLLTALVALDHWGAGYQFKTEVYFDQASRCMKIKGLGDPFLISEEIDRLVAEIHVNGIDNILGIYADTEFFSEQIEMEGRGRSANPYDAPNGALAANFNSIAINMEQGQIISGEEKTPLTPMAIQMAGGLEEGKHRISLKQPQQSSEYFIQILTAKLNQAGISVGARRCDDSHMQKHRPWMVYANSHKLEAVIAAMLKYSNNFIAHQLFLMLGADLYAAPASVEKSRRVFDEYIAQHFDWQDYQLHEGAGLSRKNQLSAQQIIDILGRFRQYRSLLGGYGEGISAKTGTLKGVRNYAGYLLQDETWLAFAIIINQPVPYRYREQLAQNLLDYLNLQE